MPSEKQIAANRRNALMSTGPKSTEGKKKVKMNALKHGGYAQFILPGESMVGFEELFEDFCRAIKPEGPAERSFVYEITRCYWIIKRIDRAEQMEVNDSVTYAVEKADGERSLETSLKGVVGYLTLYEGPKDIFERARADQRRQMNYYIGLLKKFQEMRSDNDLVPVSDQPLRNGRLDGGKSGTVAPSA